MTPNQYQGQNRDQHGEGSFFSRMMQFWIEQKLLMGIVLAATILVGLSVAPFDWDISWLPRHPVPVDAIPDIGENQQIVYTTWEGRSPKDIENQITYPLTVSLLGLPGVKAIRSNSFFGFSTIYVIFREDVEFYWSRSRILEKLNSLPSGTLPEGVQPTLGPDATALGQVFWYTLEGEGFGLDELRTMQDYYVRYYLQSAGGVSEVASIGGFIREYQIDINPDAMRAHNITLPEVFSAVRMSNVDVGAGTIEVNRAEYTIRGLGYIRSVQDVLDSVVKVNDNVPLFIKDIANVSLGPEMRRGALDKEGAEVVGGVVVVRFGENPLQVIKNVKQKIKEIGPGLATKTLPDGRTSQVKIVPFYDRTDPDPRNPRHLKESPLGRNTGYYHRRDRHGEPSCQLRFDLHYSAAGGSSDFCHYEVRGDRCQHHGPLRHSNCYRRHGGYGHHPL